MAEVSPPLPPPPPPQVAKPRPNLQEVKVPGTNIPIFTAEFLDYNKKVNSQLMQLRRVNNELQLENGRLEESIDEQEKNLAIVQNKLEKLKQENEVLERNLSKLQDMIMKMFGHLCSDMTITSAEALLNHLLSSGIDRKTINSSVENITVD
jgi:predicted nuclease with TOPRIM domain